MNMKRDPLSVGIRNAAIEIISAAPDQRIDTRDLCAALSDKFPEAKRSLIHMVLYSARNSKRCPIVASGTRHHTLRRAAPASSVNPVNSAPDEEPSTEAWKFDPVEFESPVAAPSADMQIPTVQVPGDVKSLTLKVAGVSIHIDFTK